MGSFMLCIFYHLNIFYFERENFNAQREFLLTTHPSQIPDPIISVRRLLV